MGIESAEEGEWSEDRNGKEDSSVVRKGNSVGEEILAKWLGLRAWNTEIAGARLAIATKLLLFLVVRSSTPRPRL